MDLAETTSALKRALSELGSEVSGWLQRLECQPLASAPSKKGRRQQRGRESPTTEDVVDPFEVLAVVNELSNRPEELARELREKALAARVPLEDATLKARLDFWSALAALAKEASLDCHTAPSEQTASIESYVRLEVDFDARRTRMNGRVLPTVAVSRVWSACADEIEGIRAQARQPDKFVDSLVEGVECAARRLERAAGEGVPLREAFRDVFWTSQTSHARATGHVKPYTFELFLVELAELVASRETERGGRTVRLQPVTLVKDAVTLYFKREREYRKVGTIALIRTPR